ncbi:MAG: c-type cytochrome domain-containing protein [Bacteroidota bacterium]
MDLILLASMGEFIGRFHPLWVHLPIGFLILAILLEWFQKDGSETSKKIINFCWLLAGVSAAIASVCGWMLAASGSYPEGTLFWHRWIGILLTLISFGIWWIKKQGDLIPQKSHRVLNIAVLLLLTFVGHLGGNLTHGSDYLTENAPEFVKKLTGNEANIAEGLPQIADPDSALAYADLIEPIFEQKCMACHNDEVQRGGLNMATPELLMEGGKNGAVLVAGNARESEVFKRLILPHSSEKHMPTKGEPFTFQEIAMLQWWIDEQASFDAKVSELKLEEDIPPMLFALYGMDTKPKPWYEKVRLSSLPDETISQITKEGFKLKSLSADNHLLEVRFKGDDFSSEKLQQLKSIKEHITWLYLENVDLKDEELEIIGTFSNLTRLRLQQNPITDEGITHLTDLDHLESLNLFGTNVSDAGLPTIEAMVGLKTVYLWQTNVSQAAISALRKQRPNLKIDAGALVQN